MGAKVPRPTCRVTLATPIPRDSICAKSSGVKWSPAVGAAIVLHAVSYVPITVLGLWFALRDGLNLQGIKQMSETVEVKA